MALLRNCYQIDDDKFRIRIQYRDDQDKTQLEGYWKSVINIKSAKFYPTYVDKRTAGKPTRKKAYKGVCTVEYLSTEIQLDLEVLSYLIVESVLKNRIKEAEFLSRWMKHR